MDISVIIPLFNEEESLPELYSWIERVMRENMFSYEVIFINDGSTDGSWKVVEANDRCSAGTSMPAEALFLWDVEYPYIQNQHSPKTQNTLL